MITYKSKRNRLFVMASEKKPFLSGMVQVYDPFGKELLYKLNENFRPARRRNPILRLNSEWYKLTNKLNNITNDSLTDKGMTISNGGVARVERRHTHYLE